MKKTDYFFVYGTLKKGGSFASEFDSFRVYSKAATIKGFELFNLGWFPGIVKGNGEVIGELHEYKNLDFVKQRIDNIEGYSEDYESSSLFLRRRVTAITENGEKVEANAYLFNRSIPNEAKKIENGVWNLTK